MAMIDWNEYHAQVQKRAAKAATYGPDREWPISRAAT